MKEEDIEDIEILAKVRVRLNYESTSSSLTREIWLSNLYWIDIYLTRDTTVWEINFSEE